MLAASLPPLDAAVATDGVRPPTRPANARDVWAATVSARRTACARLVELLSPVASEVLKGFPALRRHERRLERSCSGRVS